MAMEAQRQAAATAAELADTRQATAAAERERAALEQKLAEMESAEDEYDRWVLFPNVSIKL